MSRLREAAANAIEWWRTRDERRSVRETLAEHERLRVLFEDFARDPATATPVDPEKA